MKYVLVDSHDYINTKVELASDVGISGATTYFLKDDHTFSCYFID